MPIESSAALHEMLSRHRLLEPAQLSQVARLLPRYPDPRVLARELVQRGLLTPYQVNLLIQGQGRDLVLGQYILLERLGEGGMGQVFKARDQKLGRIVAVKMIRKERLADAESVQRFRREIMASSQLSHPNVVAAIDADEAEDSLALVMEYVDGIDLGRLVQTKGPLSPALACEYIRQAACGLAHAHEKGLIHRDIKPSNLIVSRSASPAVRPGTVKLLDLGLARLRHPGGDEVSAITQMGMVVGTPDYMSPEQARNSSKADIRSDLYSLGCTFYYLLTGKVPFDGETGTEKMIKHCFDQATPVDKVRPEIPPRVARIVEKLMAKQPEDRYQSPAKLVVALSRPGLLSTRSGKPLTKFLLGMLGKNPPVRADAPERLRKAARRRRWLQLNLAAAALLLLLTAGFLGIMYLRRPTDGTVNPAAQGTTPRTTIRNSSAIPTTATVVRPTIRSGERVPADLLDARSIPVEERFDWQPKELVAVIGKHRGRHWGKVNFLAMNANGQLLASGGEDGAIRLWDAATLGEQHVIRDDSGSPVAALVMAADGKTIVSGHGTGAIHVWEIGGGNPQKKMTLTGHRGSVFALALSGDGKRLASGSSDESVRVWDLDQADRREVLVIPKADSRAVLATAFSPDGKLLAFAGRDRRVHVWDLEPKPAARCVLDGHQDEVTALVFSPQGDRLHSTSNGRFVRTWNVVEKRLVRTVPISQKNDSTATFAPDGHAIAILPGPSAPVRLFTLDNDAGKERQNLGPASNGTVAATFAADGKTLATFVNYHLQVWDVAGGKPRLLVSNADLLDGSCLDISPDGGTLAIGTYHGRVRLFDLAGPAPRELPALGGHYRVVSAVRYSPDGKVLATAGYDGTLQVFATGKDSSGPLSRVTAGNGNPLVSLAWTADGKTLACGGHDRVIRIFDVKEGKLQQRGEPLTGAEPVGGIVLDSTGRTLVALMGDRRRAETARVWNLLPRKAVREDLRYPKFLLSAIDLASDGRTLALGTALGTVRFWDLGGEDAVERGTLAFPSPRGAIHGLAFAPDGKKIAGSCPGTIVLFDPASLKVLRQWNPPGAVEQFAFSPEGRHLAAVNGNGTVYLFRLEPPSSR